jgi:putative ABC transport system permease protein
MLAQNVLPLIRMLRTRPGFTAVIVLTLALGIAANTIMFSLVDGILLRPLPYPAPEQLSWIGDLGKDANKEQDFVAPADLLDWQRLTTSFQGLAGYTTLGVNLWGDAEPQRVISGLVTSNYFSLLGVSRLPLGRGFRPEEATENGDNRVVVLSHAFWQRRMASDPGVLGRTLQLDGTSHTVIGVLPAGFRSPEGNGLEEEPALWRPLAFRQQTLKREAGRWLKVIGRLKPGVTVEKAQSEMEVVNSQLASQYPATNSNRKLKVTPLAEQLVGNVRPALSMLFGAVAFVLLIGCANVSNLLLARAETRVAEFSVRLALGASRAQLIRQLLLEGVMLALLAAGIGLLIAQAGIHAIARIYAESLPRLDQVGLDGRALAFTLFASLAAVLLFGLAPALAASRTALQQTLQKAGRGGGDAGRQWIRNLLVIAEVAAALALLVGAGLLIRSFRYLLDRDPGFDPKGVLTMQMILPRSVYSNDVARAAFAEQLCQRVGSLPDAGFCAVTSFLPMTDGSADRDYYVEGRPMPQPGQVPQAGRRLVSADYFHAMGIPIVQGRSFSVNDRAESPGVAIVNEAFARREWPRESPIGKRLSVVRPEEGKWLTVVGVSRNVRHSSLEAEPAPELSQPFSQRPWFAVVLIVRARSRSSEVESLIPAVRQKVLEVDSRLPVYDIQTMDERLAHSLSRQRFALLALGALAVVGLFLSGIGIYSVMAYVVSSRTHDIGIRMALGARRQDVLRLIMSQGMFLVFLGIAGGVLLTLAVTKVIANLLFGVTPIDPPTFLAVAALMTAVAALANYIPAYRATRLDPTVALRNDAS